MDESSPVYQNFKNKMSAMTGRPKMNVTNMKTIFGDGRGRAAISGKDSTLVRGSLDSNKLFKLDGSGDLEERVAGNEKKITLLKNILKAQKPFGGKEDEIIKINSTLQDIGNILTTDYANRINEGKLDNKLLKNQLDEERKRNAERDLEKVNKSKRGSKLGSGIGSVASKITSPLEGIFDKLIAAAALLGAGIAGNAAIKWWTSLDKEQIGRVINGLKIAGIAVGGILGFQLGKTVFNIGKSAFNLGKNIVQGANKKIKRITSPKRAEKLKRAKNIKKIKKIKANKLTKNKKGFFNFGKNKKVVTAATDLGEQASKQALKKTVTKTTVKTGAKRIAAGSLPVIGAIVDGFAGFERLAKGDKTSAGLFFASAASSFLPGKGTLVSIPLTAAAIASSAKFEADKLKENDDPKVIVQDLPPIQVGDTKQKKDGLTGSDATEVPYVTSTNADNSNMKKTPKVHGILLRDN
tara:strand:+ start:636 stop:2033 length:1398 start_codon:yes stop_codon:yes gene_type:complete